MDRFNQISHLIRKIESLAEIALLAFLYYQTWDKYRPLAGPNVFYFRGKILLIGIYVLLAYILFRLCDSLNFGNLKLIEVTVSQWFSIFFVNVITYFQICLIANTMLPVTPMLQLLLIDFVVTFLCSYLFTYVFHHMYVKRDMAIVYGSENAKKLLDKFAKRADKYDITEAVSDDIGLEELKKVASRHDSIIINDIDTELRKKLIHYCYSNDIRTYMVPSISDVIVSGGEDLSLFDTPLVLIDGSGMNLEERIIKRFLDIVLGLLALIPCLLIMTIVAVAIKIEDGGPVFYKQRRLTLHDREFEMLKFRSMIVDAEKSTGAVLAKEKDSRITKVGAVLRKHRMDEIPQIFNILKGDISIVGPRPERKEIAEKICSEMPEFRYRTKVKGGLTGYAQVYGKYNTTPYDKLKMDLMYIENYSLLLDIKLMLMTPQILFRKESTEGVEE